MEHRMTLTQFEQLLDSHGATLSRWATNDQRMAMNLLADSPEARALHEDALALDALLDMAPSAPSPSTILRTHILAQRPNTAPGIACRMSHPTEPLQPEASQHRLSFLRVNHSNTFFRWRQSRWALPASALAASLVLGILSGVLMKTSVHTTTPAQAVPSVEQVFTIGLSDQLATLPTERQSDEGVSRDSGPANGGTGERFE